MQRFGHASKRNAAVFQLELAIRVERRTHYAIREVQQVVPLLSAVLVDIAAKNDALCGELLKQLKESRGADTATRQRVATCGSYACA